MGTYGQGVYGAGTYGQGAGGGGSAPVEITADLTGSGSFSADVSFGAFTFYASLSGVGDFSATIEVANAAIDINANWASAGDFSATVAAVKDLAANLTGSGTFSGTIAPVVLWDANLTGSGNFSASVSAVGPTPELDANFTGSGNFTANITPVIVDPGDPGDPGVPAGIIRWAFENTVSGERVIVPINPREMTTPTRATRGMQWSMNAGTMRGFEQAAAPRDWTFTGVLLTKSHYDLLLRWTEMLEIIEITDHLNRTFETIIQKFDPIERLPTATREWRADYTMNCLILRRLA